MTKSRVTPAADERTRKCRSSASVRRIRDMESRISAIAQTLSTPHPHGMPNSLASFAIHVDDVKRARKFYESVFSWKFEPWGPPDFYLIHTGTAEKPGIQGLMHKRTEPAAPGGLN